MMTYDPLAYGTPLALLQIPEAAIKSVGHKLSEPGAVLARYTQDCQALADLHGVVSPADLTVAAEATLDVGFICKKCQIVYPARESCVQHQRSVCMAGQPSPAKGFEPIMKLEQVQYECRACNERFSTIAEFKTHCQTQSHKTNLAKYKARREADQSPNSSSPYSSSSSSKILSPSASYTSSSKHISPSPINNSSSHSPGLPASQSSKSSHSPGIPVAHQLSRSASDMLGAPPPALFREPGAAHSLVKSEINI